MQYPRGLKHTNHTLALSSLVPSTHLEQRWRLLHDPQ